MATLRVTIRALCYSQVVENVLFFDRTDYVSADLVTLGNDIVAGWITTIKAQQILQLQYVDVRVDKMNDGSAEETATVFTSLTGAAGSNVQHPLNMALVLQKQTLLPGRQNRGRAYISGLPPSALNQGLWSSATLTSWATICTTLNGRYCLPTASSGFYLSLYAHRVDGYQTTHIARLQASSLPGSMRSRLIGHGI